MRKVSLSLKIAVLLSAVMVAALCVSGFWSAFSQQEQAQKEMLEKAQILAQEMDAVWTFFETNQHQFKTDENGNYELYCVIAAKAVSKFFTSETDYVIRYTNLTTRRKADAPDAFETEAMRSFIDQGLLEYYAMDQGEDGAQVFRYARPLFIAEPCLECHGEPAGEFDAFGYEKEGKQIGDVAGAVSIVMPVELYMSGIKASITSDVVVFGAALLVGLLVIYLCVSYLVTRPIGRLEGVAEKVKTGDLDVDVQGIGHNDEISDLAERFGAMATELRGSYDDLEAQVCDRTEALATANAELERQRVQLERANEALQKSNEFKSEFLATMSHELRTPLTSILAFAEIWEKADSGCDEREREAVREIRENGQLLLNMVDNILEVGRSEAGRIQLAIEPVEMVDLINVTEERLAFLAQKRSIAFSTSVDSNVPIIMADWDKVRRIVENLTTNAIKYTEPGGSVRVEVRAAQEQDGILVVVSDTGVGIRAENLPRIFEKYVQVDKASQTCHEGSGLGLAVVKELVELHGGWVAVRSEYGRGSEFTVFIPAGDNRWGEGGNEP